MNNNRVTRDYLSNVDNRAFGGIPPVSITHGGETNRRLHV